MSGWGDQLWGTDPWGSIAAGLLPSSLIIGNIDLNDRLNYFLIALDLGETPREEAWLIPKVLGAAPILARYVDQPAKASVTLRVKASSTVDLLTRINTVRNQFNTAGGSLVWTPNDGGTAQTMTTLPSEIDPVDLDNIGVELTLGQAVQQFMIRRWTFSFWRSPYYAGTDTTARRTPVF